MANKKIVRRVFINKRTKQASVTIPKKFFKKHQPMITFDPDLFVSLEIFNKKKKKKK